MTRKQNWYGVQARRRGESSEPIAEMNLTAANEFILRDAHMTIIALRSTMGDSASTSTSMGRGTEEGPPVREDREERPKRRRRLLQPLVHSASRHFNLGSLLASRPPGQDFLITSLRLARALAHLSCRDELLDIHACENNDNIVYECNARSETCMQQP